jgi:hypothetical protein
VPKFGERDGPPTVLDAARADFAASGARNSTGEEAF